MAIINKKRGPASTRHLQRGGFTLLIAIIFMSVMLSFGLLLGSLAFKQSQLASGAVESQYAFYAADTALECALYADQRPSPSTFDYAVNAADLNAPPPPFTCDGGSSTAPIGSFPSKTSTGGIPPSLIFSYRFDLDTSSPHPRCADVTVYKPQDTNGTTYIFSQGYDVPCATVSNSPTNARFVSRGINVHY